MQALIWSPIGPRYARPRKVAQLPRNSSGEVDGSFMDTLLVNSSTPPPRVPRACGHCLGFTPDTQFT